MDVCLVIKERLAELGFEQKDLAVAADVTESYVSQLLTGKKSPPAPNRTDIYEKMGKFLKLSSGKLAKLANLQRKEQLKRGYEDPPAPLFEAVRELILRKCAPGKQQQVRAIFEKQPFGELERLVTQKLLDVVKRVAREELESEKWLRAVARLLGGRLEPFVEATWQSASYVDFFGNLTTPPATQVGTGITGTLRHGRLGFLALTVEATNVGNADVRDSSFFPQPGQNFLPRVGAPQSGHFAAAAFPFALMRRFSSRKRSFVT